MTLPPQPIAFPPSLRYGTATVGSLAWRGNPKESGKANVLYYGERSESLLDNLTTFQESLPDDRNSLLSVRYLNHNIIKNNLT